MHSPLERCRKLNSDMTQAERSRGYHDILEPASSSWRNGGAQEGGQKAANLINGMAPLSPF